MLIWFIDNQMELLLKYNKKSNNIYKLKHLDSKTSTDIKLNIIRSK